MTLNDASTLTVTSEPSALARCASYGEPSESVSTRMIVAPGTAASAAAFTLSADRAGEQRFARTLRNGGQDRARSGALGAAVAVGVVALGEDEDEDVAAPARVGATDGGARYRRADDKPFADCMWFCGHGCSSFGVTPGFRSDPMLGPPFGSTLANG